MEAPSPESPLAAPVQLKDCIEELLKFTLLSSIQGKLQTGLSAEYCANLLRDDPSSSPLAHSGEAYLMYLLKQTRLDKLHRLPYEIQRPYMLFHEVSSGVPPYPLYKRLASSLYQSTQSGALCTSYKELIPANEDLILRKADEEWSKMIVEEGSALLSVLKEVDFELHVQQPFFSQLNDGVKTIEGRCAVNNYKRIRAGNLLLFNKSLMLQVQDVRQYSSFHEMLEAESLARVLPGVTSIEEGVQIYRNFYSEEKERSNAVLAICCQKPTSQLYLIMTSLLSGLSYSGVQKLLGFVETVGTDPTLLPPPPSTLLSGFLAPHNPVVKGSTLTIGARALAKHVNRSSEGFWGPLHGSDSDKNGHAVGVIKHLLTYCSWMNMYILRPHGTVFEIRNGDGYGARWSADGTKFVGFLEPYIVDGYSNGWKH